MSRPKSPDRRKREAQSKQLSDILGSGDWDVVGGKRVARVMGPVGPTQTVARRDLPMTWGLSKWELFIAALSQGATDAMWWVWRAGGMLGWLVLLVWLVRNGCR